MNKLIFKARNTQLEIEYRCSFYALDPSSWDEWQGEWGEYAFFHGTFGKPIEDSMIQNRDHFLQTFQEANVCTAFHTKNDTLLFHYCLVLYNLIQNNSESY